MFFSVTEVNLAYWACVGEEQGPVIAQISSHGHKGPKLHTDLDDKMIQDSETL